ncbi:MAG: TIM barrel protein [Phycisphaerae bacterium]|nr:sugar phosphate isomerase/epimerase [Phycisphaerae bacterium]NIP55411.1 sugar phosphate isomerase/epimerase [Phycisphaerae bacterium]NIS54082.1 sugar phosphate isomerase/epimerase [Phycisphaerae bacterium]NIU11724.1 sugar phosphate isomerase/epimerase [Phycisphaerae bacterium]NIU59539.1 TIM barrel protein [Phycisphaerae bacterium]
MRKFNRRQVCKALAFAPLTARLAMAQKPDKERTFRLRYIVASSMFGRMKLSQILPEIRKTGARFIDIWPEGHANQREQIEEMGYQQFAAMLKQHSVKLGILTRYDLGPFNLKDEIKVTKKLDGSMVICGSRGPGNLKGDALKAAVKKFIDKTKPQVDVAEQAGITIGIENHSNSLIRSPDSMRWFAELKTSGNIGIALAPYHLTQEPELISRLITDLDKSLVHFYAWQYGMGCHKKLPKEQELLQMPGRGELDFVPILSALKKINYSRWTEVFMHPVPRGIPIRKTAEQVTAEINRSRLYLEACLKKS